MSAFRMEMELFTNPRVLSRSFLLSEGHFDSYLSAHVIAYRLERMRKTMGPLGIGSFEISRSHAPHSSTLPFQHPVPTYGYALLFSVFGYLGIDIVLTLIKEYGALICVTVTTCRKALTIILSFTLFSKPFVFE